MGNRLDDAVMAGFLEEARGYLPVMERHLNALRNNRADGEALSELHRLAHNVRGTSNVVGFGEAAQLAEELETLIDQVSAGTMSFGDQLPELISQGLRRMAAALDSSIPAPLESPAEDLVELFLEEAEEHLHVIGSRLAALEEDPARKPALQEVRRSVHTLKGASAMVGLREMSKIAHRMEDLLDRLYQDSKAPEGEMLQLLFATYDLMSDLAIARGCPEGYGTRIQAIFDAYTGILGEERIVPSEAPRVVEPVSVSDAVEEGETEASRFVRVPLERLDMLVKQVGEMFVERSRFEQKLAHYAHETEELNLSLRRLKRIASQLESDHAIFNPGASEGNAGADEFDALELDRYTQLHLLSRDLNEAVSDVGTAGGELRNLARGFDAYVHRQSRLTSEVQEKLMRLRMAPFDWLANRLSRTVRVTAQQLNKAVNLKIEGERTELDKTVLEQLAGPLEHLLRNAVDHGIEPAGTRAARGKPERGEIRIRASCEGTEVLLRLSDDGGGIDHEKLRRAAVRVGSATEAEAASMTVERLEDLMFLPGVTTAVEVSDISGRGVGLDAVKASITALQGSLQVAAEPGQGTEFTIRLPMTLAITKVLMVESNQETFALPLSSVSRAARVEPAAIQKIGRQEAVLMGEEILPVVRLADSLKLRGVAPPPGRTAPLVMIRLGEQEFALAVDAIQQAQEVVVKPLTGIARKAKGVAAATILGNGVVVLILNPAQLRTLSGQRSARFAPLAPRAPVRKAFDILIVDDSLTVRRVIANLMRKTGWNPLEAKDGVEALEVLDKLDRKPEAILMDVEMPRMDGFELTSRLRSRAVYKNTPILMLTSRAGEKHRNKAGGLGVTEYLVKPYREQVLVGAIRKAVENARKSATEVAPAR